MMTKPSLILLRSDEPHHEALERLLAAHFDLRFTVIEPGSAQRGQLARRGRTRAWRWRVYHAWRRRLMGSTRFRRQFFAGVAPRQETTSPSMCVDSINNSSVHWILQTVEHDYVIVIGTSILAPTSLAASSRRFINIHGGCLPHYRGNHCIFEAYLDQRDDCLSATIHFIDEGVDTGGIIAVCPADVVSAPLLAGPEYFYCAAEISAFRTLIELLQHSNSAPLVGTPQPAGGRTFLTSDRKPWSELALCMAHLRHAWRRLWQRPNSSDAPT